MVVIYYLDIFGGKLAFESQSTDTKNKTISSCSLGQQNCVLFKPSKLLPMSPLKYICILHVVSTSTCISVFHVVYQVRWKHSSILHIKLYLEFSYTPHRLANVVNVE